MSVFRDVGFLLAGAAIGIPAGMFSNYLYDSLFPQTVMVESKQVGVQGLALSSPEFIFQKSRPKSNKRGYVEVRYAQGTDPSNYACNIETSHPGQFKQLDFQDDCRRANFELKNPETYPPEFLDAPARIRFEVTIKVPGAPKWQGTESIIVAFFRNI